MSERNKMKRASALRYDGDQNTAPRVTASGKGYVAQNIIDKAKENDIPIQKDPTLVSLLSELNINEQIPEELYHAVAEVFAFIYQADKSMDRH